MLDAAGLKPKDAEKYLTTCIKLARPLLLPDRVVALCAAAVPGQQLGASWCGEAVVMLTAGESQRLSIFVPRRVIDGPLSPLRTWLGERRGHVARPPRLTEWRETLAAITTSTTT